MGCESLLRGTSDLPFSRQLREDVLADDTNLNTSLP